VDWTLVIIGFVVAGIISGYLAGLFGIGGGILRIPIFVYLFTQFGTSHDVLMHVAAGTSLALVIPSALTASWKQYRMGKLNLAYYATWAPAILVGVIGGLFVLPYFSTTFLEIFFASFLLLLAIYVGFVPERFVLAKQPPGGPLKAVVAAIIGFLSVLVGIGGGAFTTPTMKAFNYPIKNAIALSSATGIVVGTAGAIGAVIAGLGVPGRPSWAWGYVDGVAFLAMFVLVAVTAPFGSWTANRLNSTLLRRVYGVFLLTMSVYMFIEVRWR